MLLIELVDLLKPRVWPADTKVFVQVGDVTHEIINITHGPVYGSVSIVAVPDIVASVGHLGTDAKQGAG